MTGVQTCALPICDFEGLFEALNGNPVCIRFLDPPLHEFVPTDEADIEALAKAQGKTVEERRVALDKLLPYQQGDFEAMYRVLEDRPMTVRYLDPPLHEFLPTRDEDIAELAAEMNIPVEELKETVASLHEFNPMMGHRGCRLAVTYPEIAEMQTRAVIQAAINVNREHPEYNIAPEIMIPLVGEAKELKFVKDIVVRVADELIKNSGVDMTYHVGTMIEIPRAAVTADEIAKEAEFFSFGTNDLTQMTFGFSRDDAGKFLGAYYDKKDRKSVV